MKVPHLKILLQHVWNRPLASFCTQKAVCSTFSWGLFWRQPIDGLLFFPPFLSNINKNKKPNISSGENKKIPQQPTTGWPKNLWTAGLHGQRSLLFLKRKYLSEFSLLFYVIILQNNDHCWSLYLYQCSMPPSLPSKLFLVLLTSVHFQYISMTTSKVSPLWTTEILWDKIQHIIGGVGNLPFFTLGCLIIANQPPSSVSASN